MLFPEWVTMTASNLQKRGLHPVGGCSLSQNALAELLDVLAGLRRVAPIQPELHDHERHHECEPED